MIAAQLTPARNELVRLVRSYIPQGSRDRIAKEQIQYLLDAPRDPFEHRHSRVHVTAAALVVSNEGEVLLHLHKRLDRWLQPGGHVEPDETPAEAAIRETREETGVVAIHPAKVPVLVDIDDHPGPKDHRHFDLRFVLLARAQTGSTEPDETGETRWVLPGDPLLGNDAGLHDAALRAVQWFQNNQGFQNNRA